MLALPPILFAQAPSGGLLPPDEHVRVRSPNPAISSDENDLLDLDIEQLRRTPVAPALETVVTSVSRQENTIGRSPAAVFVITQEMIRRSGARSIPEVLRLAPGLHVAQIDANKWAVSARGFNSRFANKFLVQIDGRSVYTPLFAGVYWDTQDLLLEDIERIEVIRGPGATVWGANAVNGVINIITQQARDTVGVYLLGGGGTEEKSFAGARVGGSAATGAVHWRVWGKWFDRDDGTSVHGPVFDDWRQGRGGLRMDWTPNCCDTLTLQGDVYQGVSGNTLRGPVIGHIPNDDTVSGGDLLARWTRTLDDASGWSIQCYFDRTDRSDAIIDQRIDTFDLDFQHHFPIGHRHNLIWGIGYRNILDDLVSPSGSAASLIPGRRRTHLVGGFIQDEVTLIDDRMFFTIGTKLENNSFTNFEIQPSARLLWSPDPRRAVWGAVSRAVRIPNRLENDLRFALGGPVLLIGNRDILAEELLAYEIGYRAQPTERFSWDMALFFNDYQNLITTNTNFPIRTLTNDMTRQTYGAELSGHLEVTECWRLSGTYTFLRESQEPRPATGAILVSPAGSSPRNQVVLSSTWDLAPGVELDVLARYVDSLPAQSVRRYTTMDVRLAWRPRCSWELGVVGQNLFDTRHFELGDDVSGTHATEVERSIYGYVTWSY